MNYGRIKGLDKEISRVVFGAGRIREKESDYELLDAMFSLGINAFDTAAVYGGGVSEKILFSWIAERGIREKVVVISKCSHHSALRKRANPFDIMSDITDSLAKPGAEYMDIYLMHRDDESVPVQAIIDTFNRLHESGKVKVFGVSNWRRERLMEANEYAYKFGLVPFSAYSPQFALAEQVREPWKGGSISISGESGKAAREYLSKNNIPVFAYSSLANGFLSGKLKSNNIEEANEVLIEASRVAYICDENIERLRRAEIMAEKKNVTVPVISLAWFLKQELNAFSIISTSKKSRMEENIQAFSVDLTKEEADWMNLL